LVALLDASGVHTIEVSTRKWVYVVVEKTMPSRNSQTDELPLVSIVTPSYNSGRFIEEAICSVLAQDYPNVEHIIVDGCSTDGTLEILQKYSDKIDWISEPDNGQSEAVNKGFRRARGAILTSYCADDLYMPYTISTAVRYLEEYPDVALVHGPGQYVDRSGKVIMTREGGDFGLERLIAVNTIMDTAVFFRREVFERIGGFDERLHYVMMWEYWVRAAASGFRLKYIPGRVLSQAREHVDSKTIRAKEAFYRERHQVFERLFNSPQLSEEIRRLKRRAYGGVYASSAFFYLRNGHIAKAAVGLSKALWMWPGVLVAYNPVLVAGNLLQAIRAARLLKLQRLGGH
jgi:glycosyltransferase involved in cell wall biosynthesis